MSEWNYHNLRRQGVIDEYSPVCFVASIDRISPCHNMSADTYLNYARDIELFPSVPQRKQNPFMARIINDLMPDIGLDSWRDLEFDRIRTPTKLNLLLRKAYQHGMRVVVDISSEFDEDGKPNDKDVVHALGVLPLSNSADRFRLRSTWVPRALSGIVTPELLVDFMSQPKERPSRHFPFNDTNVLIIPNVSTYKESKRTISTGPK